MTIKLAWDNTNPIVANKGGVKSYLGSMVGCQSKQRTVDMFPIMMSGALNIQDTPRKAELREETKYMRTLAKAKALVNKLNATSCGT